MTGPYQHNGSVEACTKFLQHMTAQPTEPVKAEDDYIKSYNLAVWLVEFEFMDPKNKDMTIRKLTRLYASKIEGLLTQARATERSTVLDLVEKEVINRIYEIYITNDDITLGQDTINKWNLLRLNQNKALQQLRLGDGSGYINTSSVPDTGEDQ